MTASPGLEPGPEPDPPEPAAAEAATGGPAPDPRRGVIGPFTARQLAGALLVVVVAAIVLVLVTRPIAPGTGSGLPTALPGATPFLVGEARVGLQPGDQAPELQWQGADGTTAQLTDLRGNPVRLADLRGKVVLLNFWATWCPPCQSETPVLRDLADQDRDKGLVVIGVAVQETSVDNVKAYADRYEISYPIAFDASAHIFDLYRVYALPTQVVVGPDGRIVSVVNGPLTVDSAERLVRPWLPGADPGSS